MGEQTSGDSPARPIGRPTRYGQRSATAIRFPTEMLERLHAESEMRGVSTNWLVVRAVERFLADLLPIEEMILTVADRARQEGRHNHGGGDDAAGGKAGLPVRQDAEPSTGEPAVEPPPVTPEGMGSGVGALGSQPPAPVHPSAQDNGSTEQSQ